MSPEVAALVQSIHPIQTHTLKKGSQAIKERAQGVLVNTLRVIERTIDLLKSATYCEERSWFVALLNREAGGGYHPWDHLSLPPLSEQVQEDNSPSEISKETLRHIQLVSDREKWHKSVQMILELPFAFDDEGGLLPDIYQGLLTMNEVSICFKIASSSIIYPFSSL